MSDLVEKKVRFLKEKLEDLKLEISRLEREDKAGLLSPIERMKMSSLQQEKNEIVARIKELLM